MLLTQEVEVILNNKIIKYYEDLGYEILRYKDKYGILRVKKDTKIKVKTKDLQLQSRTKVIVKCDNCPKQYSIEFYRYNNSIHEDGKYYCQKCANKLFIIPKQQKTSLLKSKSFEKWCIENNEQDVLNRWDYELNDCAPDEVCYCSTSKKYYFKCPKGLHNSELKYISNFTKGQKGTMECKSCNSFAQWGIDNICEDFLEKYWSNKNIINPWEIAKYSNNKVWIKCQQKDYHESYNISCNMFIIGQRCGYCYSKKVHPLDSLLNLRPDLAEEWHENNKIKSSEVSLGSSKKVKWKCKKCKHEWNAVINSRTNGVGCPHCSMSKAEVIISEYLNKNNINYIPQKTFKDLIGIGGGNLSYDFYIPNYGLIEFQGQFHDGNNGKGNYYMKQNLKKQQEHDLRKRNYAQNHNIKLLEIWYYDFDRIEEILDKELELHNNIGLLEARNIVQKNLKEKQLSNEEFRKSVTKLRCNILDSNSLINI